VTKLPMVVGMKATSSTWLEPATSLQWQYEIK